MYKLKQELPKEFKIKVNPKQSEALQKHCVSIGIKSLDISDKVEYVNYPYVYRRSTNTYLSADNESAYHKNKFKKDVLPRIKFKDYFEKVEIYTNKEFPNFSNLLNSNDFPEKWCILVTEDNYQELNTWMHRNWKNYENYTEDWNIIKGNYYFMSCSEKGGWSNYNVPIDYKLITTEQFRAKYGDLNPKNEGYTTVSDKTIKEEYEERKQLRFENEHLKEENDKLKHKILMLTEKLETIKKVIE